MITVFNREAVLLTYEQKSFFSVQQKLSHAGVGYRTKVRDTGLHRIGRMGTLGMQEEYRYEYTVFVHRKDAQWAKHVLQTD